VPRLDALLALNMGFSKSNARQLIGAGLVHDRAGNVLHDERLNISESQLPFGATIDGQPMELVVVSYVLQHKPVGCVTALHDARHPTAYALLDDAPLFSELRPVGRLDLDTSGLLLWTSDGQWLQRLTHPKRAVPRTYHAALARSFGPPPAAGLTLDDGHRPQIEALATLAPGDAHPALAIPPETATLATITIVGGAYHEVRRIFAALDSHVLALCRVSFGRLALPRDLDAGSFRAIAPTDV
jgi:16S rRNA pseudouridine516 synthase